MPPLRVLNTVSVHARSSSDVCFSDVRATGMPRSPRAKPASCLIWAFLGGVGVGLFGSGGEICNIGFVTKVRLKKKGDVNSGLSRVVSFISDWAQRAHRRPTRILISNKIGALKRLLRWGWLHSSLARGGWHPAFLVEDPQIFLIVDD